MSGRLGLDVEASGVQQAVEMLGGIGLRAQYPRRAYQRVELDFGRQMGRVFASEGAAAHQHWAPLTDDTLESKSAEGLSPNVLQATGRLRASLVSRSADSLHEVGPHGVTLGTRVPYAIPAQHRKGVPRRPISVPDAAQAQWVDWVTQEIVEGRP